MTVPEQHQLKIAWRTLRMSDVMVQVLGGMTKEEAIEIIKRNKSRGQRNDGRTTSHS